MQIVSDLSHTAAFGPVLGIQGALSRILCEKPLAFREMPKNIAAQPHRHNRTRSKTNPGKPKPFGTEVGKADS